MTADKQDKGKGKERPRDQDQQDRGRDQDEGEGQMQETRQRPPPLPAVKGTIGAIESPSRRSFYSGSPVSPSTNRGHHSSAPSYDYTNTNTNDINSTFASKAETQSPQQQQQQQQQQQLGQVLRRERPVFRVDHTMTNCFDRLKLEKKDEIRALFGA